MISNPKLTVLPEQPTSSAGRIPGRKLFCPLCSALLKYRDRRFRIIKFEGGITKWIRIRRFRCTGCRKLHTELPSILIPYKHYAAEVICGVLDRVITPDDPDSEDQPVAQTMLRWISWFTQLIQRIEEILQRTLLRPELPHSSRLFSLCRIFRKIYPDWLERIVRIVCNNGENLWKCR